jgi:16S rRNA (cytidine1402-2'-O)-methyltransferase
VVNHIVKPLAPGLYFVATPIGTARDITLRALDILASADVIAAEDTRSMKRLLDIHGVPLGDRPVLAYHDHNGDKMRPRLLAYLAEGKSVAYASEAGTPLIADPGFDLGRVARSEGYLVTAAPGPSAVIDALNISGLPTDRFMFAGFLPNAQKARQTALSELSEIPATLVFYESPKRVAQMIADAATVLGGTRQAALCRELTKKFEECLNGTLNELTEALSERTLKGECVVLIDRKGDEDGEDMDVEAALRDALKTMSLRDASEAVSKASGLPKRKIYQLALEIGKTDQN